MTPITRRGGAPHDSGTQPQPHYCTVRVDADGHRHGCPDWPHCIFRGTAAVPGQPAEPDDDIDEPDEDEVPDIARDLAALAGFAAGAVVFLLVAFTLVLVMIR